MKKNRIFYYCILLFISFAAKNGIAQTRLDQRISINARQVKLASLLDTLGRKNGFYFSYSNGQFNGDSLVSVAVHQQPLRVVLDTLFKGAIDYKESPGYVILRLAPNNLTMQAETAGGRAQNYYISGYVLDERTGLGIPNASVYEKRLLVSTLTDKKGFFKIRIRSAAMVTLTVSKELYRDASVNFLSDVTISLQPENASYQMDTSPDRVEKSWLGRIFISSANRIQSVNLGGYFREVPFQTSFTPGLSSHGMMSSQVVNHFSLNALGGYTAGLDGVELAGLFNINKQDVRYLQLAGLFNVVGGNFCGVQLAGLGNHVAKRSSGLQMAGIYNLAKKRNGLSVAGITNITSDTAKGLQVAGILNKAKTMNGVSVGIVNIADTLNGYALGLLNLSHNGYHRIMVYSNEIAAANVGLKTGNHKLYAVLSAGIQPSDQLTYFAIGLGIGHDFVFNDRYTLSAEFSNHSLLSGKLKHGHNINRINALFDYRITPKFSLFGGPSFNFYYTADGAEDEEGQVTRHKFGLMDIGRNKGWIGWTVGLSFL